MRDTSERLERAPALGQGGACLATGGWPLVHEASSGPAGDVAGGRTR